MPDIITDFPAIKRAAIGLRNTFPQDEVKPVRERPETLASYFPREIEFGDLIWSDDKGGYVPKCGLYVAPLKDGA